MNSITVKRAVPADLNAFVASVVQLFAEDAGVHDAAMDVSWPMHSGADYYSGLLSDENCMLAVASDDGRLVGHLSAQLLEPSALRPHRFAVLESMRIDTAFRGRGVGQHLVDHFLDWARERDAEQASVNAYAANENAQRLYRRCGFTPMSITMRISL